ncbi:MAG: glycosyltransferase [Patescibacteria group bacterium]
MEKKKMRILIANETYPPNLNGAATFTQRLAQNLSKKGHIVAVIAPGLKFGDHLEIDNCGVAIHRVRSLPVKMVHPNFRVIVKPDIYTAVRKIVKDFKPDVIHIQNHFTLGRACIKAAEKTHTPIIGTNHFMPDNLVQFAPSFAEGTMIRVMWGDFLRVYNKLDYVTAPSKIAIKMIKDIGYDKKAEVVSNGMEFDKFKKRPVSDALLKKYKIFKNIPTFISVGRIEKDKNLDVILEALAIYLKKHKAQLILVGNGKFEKEFKKLAVLLKVEDRVFFTGKISDRELREIYSLADVYIGAGTAELQGLSVMEGMASGLPVLAVNAVALPELVKNGVNGYLFELSAEDLAGKMDKILKDEKRLEKMAQESLKIISEHDIVKTIAKFERIYEKVIEEKKKSSSKSKK